jgi:hypothetical protein
MEINPQKFAAVVSAVASIGLIGCTVYFLFIIFFGVKAPEQVSDVSQVNSSAFGPKVQEAASVLTGAKKISFKQKDMAFTESALFKNFTDLPETVSLTNERGRPDPFVPYVAP